MKLTPQLHLLEDTRKNKLEREVEEEYKVLKDKKTQEVKSAKMQGHSPSHKTTASGKK